MRSFFLLGLGLGVLVSMPSASADEIGLPTRTFVQSWTPLPTGRFVPTSSHVSIKSPRIQFEPQIDAKRGGLLDDSFASSHADAERRGIVFSEMTAPWDQHKRTGFQRLRDAQAAYAGADEARHKQFAATLARAIGGVGRSVADAGSSFADLDKAYGAVLGRQPGDARVAAEAEQARWRTYSDAFAAFAEEQTPGSAAAVTAELGRQRVNDLTNAPGRD